MAYISEVTFFYVEARVAIYCQLMLMTAGKIFDVGKGVRTGLKESKVRLGSQHNWLLADMLSHKKWCCMTYEKVKGLTVHSTSFEKPFFCFLFFFVFFLLVWCFAWRFIQIIKKRF